jgi:hypothetical protein
MIRVPSAALSHLILATEERLAKLREMGTRPETEWPESYDGNDVWVYEQILEILRRAHPGGEIDLGRGKHNWFLTALIPEYVDRTRSQLTTEELDALRAVYGQSPVASGPFPA